MSTIFFSLKVEFIVIFLKQLGNFIVKENVKVHITKNNLVVALIMYSNKK